MEVQVGVSNRHIHLTPENFQKLFGNVPLAVDKTLVQPGQFASNLYVTLKTPKATIEHVRVMGPLRNYTQIEISTTDAYKLGINPPVRSSGDLDGTPEIQVLGSAGSILTNGVIIANRHIHMTPAMRTEMGLDAVNEVSVTFGSEKSVTFYNVKLKVQDTAAWEMHIDTDDANGSLIKTGDMGTIL